ncbi:hypothetical protein GOV14_04185 [Candidatus Pacearchaeota archaeon]|nr:hypothetical protein [Candidatus Pacearchaeota archaeon]
MDSVHAAVWSPQLCGYIIATREDVEKVPIVELIKFREALQREEYINTEHERELEVERVRFIGWLDELIIEKLEKGHRY